MTRSDFNQAPRCPEEVYSWESISTVQTAIGDFNVVLVMSDEENQPPDAAMIVQANQLIDFCKANTDLIWRIVFGSYLYVSRTDPLELQTSEIPTGVNSTELHRFISGRTLIVHKDTSTESGYLNTIQIIPDWDHEHALAMNVFGGQITEINDCSFRFEGAELLLE